jgi:hypothetical protein
MRQGIVIKITTLPTKLQPVPTLEKVHSVKAASLLIPYSRITTAKNSSFEVIA